MKIRSLSRFATLLLAATAAHHSFAEDWGAYSIIPVSAPGMVLEAVDSGSTDGTIVSIGKPANSPNQKWLIIPKDGGFVSIKPSYDSKLVLAIAKGGKNNGTQAVLETDEGKPWQEWSLKKNESGAYNLLPRHVPDKGLDDNGGKKEPGSRQDLWSFRGRDQHLQWNLDQAARRQSAVMAAASLVGVNGAPPAYTAAGDRSQGHPPRRPPRRPLSPRASSSPAPFGMSSSSSPPNTMGANPRASM